MFCSLEIGASSNPCSDIFAGPEAFSEPEAVRLADFIASFAGQIKVFLAFHSYGQYILFPHGHTENPSANFDVMVRFFKNKF